MKASVDVERTRTLFAPSDLPRGHDLACLFRLCSARAVKTASTAVTPDALPEVRKAYGPGRPQYADSTVGGYGFQGGRAEQVIRVFIGQRSQAGDGVVFATAARPPRPGLLARLFRRGRR